MEDITIVFTEREAVDVRQGIILAIKELDKFDEGSDWRLADRLEIILEKFDLKS